MTAIMVVVQRRKRFISISNLVLISGFAATTLTKTLFQTNYLSVYVALYLSLSLSRVIYSIFWDGLKVMVIISNLCAKLQLLL